MSDTTIVFDPKNGGACVKALFERPYGEAMKMPLPDPVVGADVYRLSVVDLSHKLAVIVPNVGSWVVSASVGALVYGGAEPSAIFDTLAHQLTQLGRNLTASAEHKA